MTFPGARRANRFPVLVGLIADLPAEGWTAERRDHFMRVFGMALDYCIPIADPSPAFSPPGGPIAPVPGHQSRESGSPEVAMQNTSSTAPPRRRGGLSGGEDDQLTEGRT